MKRALSPAEIELLDGVDAQIQACGDGLVETGNPYYAWQAIKLCGFYKKDFPRWVREYLVVCCAARICSKHAKQTGDLRKVLPHALGFPNLWDEGKRQIGPGNLLDPNVGTTPDLWFPILFESLIWEGQEPAEAARIAANKALDSKTAGVDDRTLRRWLMNYFELTRWPRKAAEWKEIFEQHYVAIGARDGSYD